MKGPAPLSPNPYSLPEPWNLTADGYAQVTMKNLGQYAAEAVRLAQLQPHWHILDVACGPGTVPLMIAHRVKRISALDFSTDMLACFRKKMEGGGYSHIEIHEGDGQVLPFEDASFDAAFSMFGLMFFPDRVKGFRELHRTLKVEARAYVTSWAPVDRSPLMKIMFEAVQQITGDASPPSKTAMTLENPGVFRAEMIAAGFREVEILPITKQFHFDSVKQFWSDMVKGSAPLVVLRKKMGELAWLEKEPQALDLLRRKLPNGPFSLSSDSWLGVGRK